MAIEIERKFLVKNDSWKSQSFDNKQIAQGYLNSSPERTVRVRVMGSKGFLTIKSKSQGNSRSEYEYEIPVNEAKEMLLLCEKPILSKTRYLVNHSNHLWEIDEFEQENKGLIVAEVELAHETEEVIIPDWIGKEVTEETKYYNSQLVLFPFQEWAK